MRATLLFLLGVLVALVIGLGASFIGALAEPMARWAGLSAHDAAVFNGQVDIGIIFIFLYAVCMMRKR